MSKSLSDKLQINNCSENKILEQCYRHEEPSTPRSQDIGTDFTYKHTVVWSLVIIFMLLHIVGLCGYIIECFGFFKIKTFIWMWIFGYATGEGVTIGAHRYYSHKSFKATPLFRAILLCLQTASGQMSMFKWVRDHRLHHRYTDTDADPHNSKRGFFFSHIGWLMVKKHPYVTEFGKKIDMSDLQADWMVMFQKKYYIPLYIVIGILIPVWIPVYFFEETWWKSVWCAYIMRYLFSLNFTWLVNSAAHIYGTRPYDKSILPTESWCVSLITLGEGWHNYHHAFPWDYRTAEFKFLNMTAYLIKFAEAIGLAYDLKTASPEMVAKRVLRTGDRTSHILGSEKDQSVHRHLYNIHSTSCSHLILVLQVILIIAAMFLLCPTAGHRLPHNE